MNWNLFAENCTATHQGCDTVWNTNLRYFYRDLIGGSLSTDRLQSFCRFGLLIGNYYINPLNE